MSLTAPSPILGKEEKGLCVVHLVCHEDVKSGSLLSAALPGTLIIVPKKLAFPRKKKPCCNNSDTVLCSWNIWCQLWLILGKAGQEEELLKSWNLSHSKGESGRALASFLLQLRLPASLWSICWAWREVLLIMMIPTCLGLTFPLECAQVQGYTYFHKLKFTVPSWGTGSGLASILSANSVVSKLLFQHPIMFSCVKHFSLGWTHSTNCGNRWQ